MNKDVVRLIERYVWKYRVAMWNMQYNKSTNCTDFDGVLYNNNKYNYRFSGENYEYSKDIYDLKMRIVAMLSGNY